MDPNFNRKLIEQVKRYECLYNITSPEFRNASWKARIWQKVGQDLKTRESVCQKRWKTLRDSYRRMVRSEELAKFECKPIPKRNFKFAKALSFLDGRTQESSDDDDDDDGGDDDDEEKQEIRKNNQTEDSCINLPSSNNTHTYVSYSDDDDGCTLDFGASSFTDNSTVKIENSEILERTHANVMPSTDPLVTRNSTFIFFESLAHKVLSAGLSQSEVDDIELKVASVVYKEISNCRKKRNT